MRHSGLLALVPTQLERDGIARHVDIECALCAFGPIVAAARTVQLIAECRPEKVLLLGIAGGFDDGAEVGTAYMFREVACYGVGVGSGDEFQTASAMGWAQWSDRGATINERLGLHIPAGRSTVIGELLLTTPSISSHQGDARRRRELFPRAIAEDMEGFGVAVACHLSGVPLTIVRGISNVVGDRDHQNWRVDDALAAVAESARAILSG